VYCSHCGQPAGGNFCSACGKALTAAQVPLAEVVPIDWRCEVNYEALLTAKEVRDRIARAGRMHRKQMSGEELLATFDKLVPMGVPLEKIAVLAQPLYARLGLNMTKTAQRQLPLPVGQVLVGVLCALAKEGCELTWVDQADDGCVLHATIPSSIWSFAGELLITVELAGQSTRVEANAKIPGQKFDWGRSQRLLDSLLGSTAAFAA